MLPQFAQADKRKPAALRNDSNSDLLPGTFARLRAYRLLRNAARRQGPAVAIANAIYHATGKRVRDLPITIDKLMRE